MYNYQKRSLYFLTMKLLYYIYDIIIWWLTNAETFYDNDINLYELIVFFKNRAICCSKNNLSIVLVEYISNQFLVDIRFNSTFELNLIV